MPGAMRRLHMTTIIIPATVCCRGALKGMCGQRNRMNTDAMASLLRASLASPNGPGGMNTPVAVGISCGAALMTVITTPAHDLYYIPGHYQKHSHAMATSHVPCRHRCGHIYHTKITSCPKHPHRPVTCKWCHTSTHTPPDRASHWQHARCCPMCVCVRACVRVCFLIRQLQCSNCSTRPRCSPRSEKNQPEKKLCLFVPS